MLPFFCGICDLPIKATKRVDTSPGPLTIPLTTQKNISVNKLDFLMCFFFTSRFSMSTFVGQAHWQPLPAPKPHNKFENKKIAPLVFRFWSPSRAVRL